VRLPITEEVCEFLQKIKLLIAKGENDFEIKVLLFKQEFIDFRIDSLMRNLLSSMELTTRQSAIFI
jgi:hypothetical protein